MASIKRHLQRELFLFLTIISLVTSLALGYVLRFQFEIDFSAIVIDVIQYPGQHVFRLLNLAVVPLFVVTTVSGVCSMQTAANNGKTGLLILMYYTGTSFVSASLGLAVAMVSKKYMLRVIGSVEQTALENAKLYNPLTAYQGSALDVAMDFFRNVVPFNIMDAITSSVVTEFTKETVFQNENTTLLVTNRLISSVPGPNLIGLIAFSVMFGLALIKLGQECDTMVTSIHTLSRAILTMVTGFSWVIPIGIVSNIVATFLQAKDVHPFANFVAVFCGSVIAVLLLYIFLFLNAIYLLAVRKNPFVFCKNILPAMLTALGTGCSIVTLPVTFHSLEYRAKVDPVVSRLILPLGSVINRDGGAFFDAFTAVFFAGVNKVDLKVYDYLILCLVCVALSMYMPKLSATSVSTTLVFLSVGLPLYQLPIIVGLKLFMLGRLCTMVSVTSDCFGCAIIDSICRRRLNFARRTSIARGNSLRRSRPGSIKRDGSVRGGRASQNNTLTIPVGSGRAATDQESFRMPPLSARSAGSEQVFKNESVA